MELRTSPSFGAGRRCNGSIFVIYSNTDSRSSSQEDPDPIALALARAGNSMVGGASRAVKLTDDRVAVLAFAQKLAEIIFHVPLKATDFIRRIYNMCACGTLSIAHRPCKENSCNLPILISV